jgi:hypothetical protein
VCDGFERPTLDTTLWGPFSDPGATVTIDSTRSARGGRSVHLHTDAGYGDAVGFGCGGDFSCVSNPAYLRVFVWVPSGLRFSAARISLDNANFQSVDVSWNGPSMALDGVIADTTQDHAFPGHDRWVCLLLKVDTTAPGEFSVFADGQSTPLLTTRLTAAPKFKRMMFVIDPDGSEQQATDIWFDEVVMSATPIGCSD